MDYINALEKILKKKAIINFLPLQPGDVPDTYASVDNLKKQFNYKPSTSVIEGVLTLWNGINIIIKINSKNIEL